MSTYGKPNYWMAAALLAKLYLNWGVYTNDITTVNNSTPNPKLNDCVYWCDKIIESGLFEVGVGYRQKFYPDNGVHIKDFIYALDVDPATKGMVLPHGTVGSASRKRACAAPIRSASTTTNLLQDRPC